jgi:hypothetical protein
MGEEKYLQSFGGKLRERNHIEDIGLDGWVILRCIFTEWECGE